jgi:serine/threonine-protein kinase
MDTPQARPSTGPKAAPDLGATTAPPGPDLGTTTAPAGTDLGATTPPAGAELEATTPPGGAPLGETTAPAGAATQAAPTAGAPKQPAQKISALGDFKLVKKLGAGGMGEVYLGHQISLDRPAAVKVMAKHLADNKSFVERFYREARLMAKLDHPHIIRSYGVGFEHGRHYLAMEFVDGGSLQDWLKKLGKLTVPDALHVIIGCARALEHANEHSIVHRDIKPDNVLLTRQGMVKLADLGLAKATEEDTGLTQSGVGAGTPLYMAPEQAASAKYADHRSDIYALGCMCYCLLTGKPPFEGETTLALLKAKEAGTFPPARRSNSDVPERLDLMMDKMIAKKPELRYQTCTELIKDLESLGLAAARLSFFGAEARPSPVGSTTVSAMGKTAAPPAAKTAPPKPQPDEIWHVSYRDADGDRVIKKLNTTQLKALIQQPDFDIEAKASRKPDEPKRALASFKEFQHALQGRLAKAKADQKSAKYHNMYEQIEKEQLSRERWAGIKRMFGKAKDGLGLVFWLAILGVGLVFAFIVVSRMTQ